MKTIDIRTIIKNGVRMLFGQCMRLALNSNLEMLYDQSVTCFPTLETKTARQRILVVSAPLQISSVLPWLQNMRERF